MKKETFYNNNKQIIHYQFDSILEILDFIEKNKRITSSESSETGDKNFTGTNSFAQAFDMCKNGYFSKNVESFQNIFFKLQEIITKKIQLIKVKHDFVGGFPDVPLYLIGHPLNMINLDIKQKKALPKIIFHFNASISSCKKKSTIEKKGLVTLLLYEIFKRLNFPVEIHLHEVCSHRDIVLNNSLILLKENDMLNISKIYFPLVHPSFLRRIMFALEERIPELKYTQSFFSGYGYPYPIKDFLSLTNQDVDDSSIHIFSDDYEYENIKSALKQAINSIQNQKKLQIDTEEFFKSIDSFDFSSIQTFNDYERE